MIAVDTSALLAVALDQPEAGRCAAVLAADDLLLISAGTLAEALLVAALRGVDDEVAHLLEGLPFEVVPVTAASARRVAHAYRRWGKGQHPARLNFGDCFAYETARAHGCPLLFVGNDFAQTDIESAL